MVGTKEPTVICELCNDTGWVLNEFREAKRCAHGKPDFKERQFKDPENHEREPGDDPPF